jgi:heptaprenyl diphosphate synthase
MPLSTHDVQLFEYPPQVRNDLKRVECALVEAVLSRNAEVDPILMHLIGSGGKRLRPAMLLLSSMFGSPCGTKAIELAAACELIHTATLYHDDIMDRSQTRRHRPSANLRWGNHIAAFAGDYIVSQAITLVALQGDHITRMVSTYLDRVCMGQAAEFKSAYSIEDQDEAHYLRVIELKTASLYELACRLGGLLSEAPPSVVKLLTDYGRYIGIAFQMVDDLLDIVADPQILGKPAASDLREGTYTLPVIYAIRAGDPDAQRLRHLLEHRDLCNDEFAEVLSILRNSISVRRVLELVRDLLEQAKEQIALLPDNPANDSLIALADYVGSRGPLSSI